MANVQSFESGFDLGLGRAQQEQQRREALRDQELQGKIGDLIDSRKSLQAKLPTLLDDKGNPTPEYNQTVDALTQNARDLREIYHPQKNPGAIEKFGHLLTDALHLTSPESRAAKQFATQQKLHAGDVAETKRLVAAAPLSPEQQAVVQARSQAAGKMEEIQQAMKDYDRLNPQAPPEERQAFLSDLITKAYGGTIIGNWERVTGKVNGQPVTLDFDKRTHRYRYPSGEDVPENILATFIPDPKTKPPAMKGLKFDPATGQVVDQDTTQRYNEGDPKNPPEVAAMFTGAKRVLKQKEDFQAKLVQDRGSSYGIARQMAPLQVLDTANGNAPTFVTYLEMKKNPGRYLPANSASKAISQENLMQDLTGVSSTLRQDISGMAEDFPEDMKAKIAVAASADNAASALSQLIASGALGSLSDDQFKVYVDLQQLAENAMSMRTILGAGQGSEDVRRAIQATLPSLLSPNKKFALIQLDAYDNTIKRLHRGVPKVPLRTDISQGGSAGESVETPVQQQFIYARDAKSKLHKAKKGTKLPEGWTQVSGPQE